MRALGRLETPGSLCVVTRPGREHPGGLWTYSHLDVRTVQEWPPVFQGQGQGWSGPAGRAAHSSLGAHTRREKHCDQGPRADK